MMLEQVFMAVLAGLTYGLTHVAKKLQAGQKFDVWKLVATEVVAVFVAVSLVLSGAKLNELTFEQQFMLYAGLIPLTENVLKALYRAIENKAVEHTYKGLPKK